MNAHEFIASVIEHWTAARGVTPVNAHEFIASVMEHWTAAHRVTP